MGFSVLLVAAAAAAQTHWVPLNNTQAKQGQVSTPASVQAAAPSAPIAAPAMTTATLRVGTEIPLRLVEELTN
jgi:hypothetical protein